jgi:ubiquinone/menaquinone biosynthesis C-methylase UbiE
MSLAFLFLAGQIREMERASAIKLIEGGIDTSIHRQVWIDLGAGSGTFTIALAGLLDPESLVYAVDRDKQSLNRIEKNDRGAKIITLHADFMKDDLADIQPNGILMANALHYVEDQFSFLTTIKNKLASGGRILIVEYDLKNPNAWVPFPIGFGELKGLAARVGFTSVTRLAEVSSVYHNGMIYGALVIG